jgi:prevent-host-death family protein
MITAGIRDLKNQLTKYIELVKEGATVIVTDRGKPVAILHDLSNIEVDAGHDEVLASMAAAGKVKLPVRGGGIRNFKATLIKGKSISETIVEDRR